jgi:16S rRNA (guanine527-N7)-methyltransferase
MKLQDAATARRATVKQGSTDMPDVSLLEDGARQLGIELSSEQIERFQRYMELLLDWSQRVSLTAVRDGEGIQRRHFLESIALLPVLAAQGLSLDGRTLVDVGSGAGVPGVPLKIMEPGLRVMLIEAKQRKSEFLRALLPGLGFDDVNVVTERAEDAAHDPRYRESFDFASAKALAPLRTLAELTLPFVRMGGIVIAPKGTEAAAEVKDAAPALEALNGSVRAVAAIPLAAPEQFVVLVNKDLPTPERFPRKPGMPAKRPL